MKTKKAVLYLDVDGVLIQWRQDRTREFYRCHPRGHGARRVSDFIMWADKNFEVRWLTCWAMCGKMRLEMLTELRNILDTPELPDTWDNPMDWANTHTNVPKGHRVDGVCCDTNKVNGIDLTETRPWFWLDDEDFERIFMPAHFQNRLIKTDCSVDRNGLLAATREMCIRLGWKFPHFADV